MRILVKFMPGTTRTQKDAVHAELGGTLIRDITRLDVDLVEGDLLSYQNHPLVRYAEEEVTLEPAFIPNDPLWDNATALKQIGLEEAWDISDGDGVAIAILDTGIDQNHPDIAPKIIQNFVLDGSGDPDDYTEGMGHGTSVASVAGALTNNNHGAIGVGFNCQVINIKVRGVSSQLAEGITLAVDSGAKVINVSWAGWLSPLAILEDAVNYAWDNGAIVVWAAGNASSDEPQYPPASPNCISVAASYGFYAGEWRLAEWSNYGDWVDVAAPGTANPAACRMGTGTIPGMPDYNYFIGTSSSAPVVVGLAALLFALGLNNVEVREAILKTCEPVTHDIYDRPRTVKYGHINAEAALNSLNTFTPEEAFLVDISLIANDTTAFNILFQVAFGTYNPDTDEFTPLDDAQVEQILQLELGESLKSLTFSTAHEGLWDLLVKVVNPQTGEPFASMVRPGLIKVESS